MDLIFGISLERIFKVKQWCCLDRCERTNEREEIFIVISRQKKDREPSNIALEKNFDLNATLNAILCTTCATLFQFFIINGITSEWSTIRSPEWFILWMILLSSTSHTPEHDIFYRWKENSRVLEKFLISLIISISDQTSKWSDILVISEIFLTDS